MSQPFRLSETYRRLLVYEYDDGKHMITSASKQKGITHQRLTERGCYVPENGTASYEKEASPDKYPGLSELQNILQAIVERSEGNRWSQYAFEDLNGAFWQMTRDDYLCH